MLTIDNLTDMLCQIIQQLKLTVRQIDIFAALGNRVGIRMNRQIANLNISILGFGCWRCGSCSAAPSRAGCSTRSGFWCSCGCSCR